MAAPLLLLAPNMSSSPLSENGGGQQKGKQQSKQNDVFKRVVATGTGDI